MIELAKNGDFRLSQLNSLKVELVHTNSPALFDVFGYDEMEMRCRIGTNSTLVFLFSFMMGASKGLDIPLTIPFIDAIVAYSGIKNISQYFQRSRATSDFFQNQFQPPLSTGPTRLG